jgi:hypothetical protein
MTQERKLIFLSFFFVLKLSVVHAEDNYIKQNTNTLKVCSENMELKSYIEILNNTYSNWDKKFIDSIHKKAVILFQTDSNYFLFTNQLKTDQFLIDKLIDTKSIKIICRSQINDTVPFLIIKKDNQRKFESERLFYFVYRGNKNFNELDSLSKFFNRILLINATNADHIIKNEIELTIAHESIHLFSQNEIFDGIPPLRIEDVLVNENGNDKTNLEKINFEDEKCSFEINEIQKYSNREYLDFKYRCLPKFKELIQKEICLDKELINTIVNKNEDNNYSKFRTTIILIEIFKLLREKNNLYLDNNLALEWYWYLAEGLPQYFEQKILIKRRSTRILKNYDEHCSLANNSSDMFFYPLLTGSAIWHGLEFIYDSESEWGHLAEQTVENIPTISSSEDWIADRLSMLEKKLISINLN